MKAGSSCLALGALLMLLKHLLQDFIHASFLEIRRLQGMDNIHPSKAAIARPPIGIVGDIGGPRIKLRPEGAEFQFVLESNSRGMIQMYCRTQPSQLKSASMAPLIRALMNSVASGSVP